MNLNDPTYIKFDGTPDIGRVPPRLAIDGGMDALTGEQMAAVEQVYLQFRSACRLSIAPFHTERVTLTDGTEVHLWSLHGRDEVLVRPAGGTAGKFLPHGFVVATNWNTPLFYCRDLNDGVRWVIGTDNVAQVDGPASAIFDNQVFRKSGDSYFNLPFVFNRSDQTIWDYAFNAGLTGGDSPTVPFRIKDSTTSELTFEATHYTHKNLIVDTGGATLYAMDEAPIILAPSSPEYPEAIHYLPAQTDAAGNQVALQQWRYATLSLTTNIWLFRMASERLERTGDNTYRLVERVVREFVTPWGKQTTAVSAIDDYQMGEDPAVLLKLRYTEARIPGAVGGAGYPTGGPGYYIRWRTGWRGTDVWIDISGVPLRLSNVSCKRQIIEQGNGAFTATKVLAAAGATDVGYIDIESRLNYPASIYWRGGDAIKAYFDTDLLKFLGYTGYDPYLPGNVRVTDAQIYRYDTNYSVDGVPTVTAALGWMDLKLLEGTTAGRMTGKEHTNRQVRHGVYTWDGVTHITKGIVPPGVAEGAYLVANNVLDEYLADRAANETDGPTIEFDYLHNERPANSVSYALKSRYVIDYDHKGRFYAAIRCEVECSGATWKENAGIYKGYMEVNENPTYTVRIWFETCWNDIATEQLLVEETATRPCFEAITVQMFNPWYWQFPALMDRDCKVRKPPEPTPNEDFMKMFENLASHQGVNTHLCCADVRPDITGDDVALTQSKDGIEYSLQSGTTVIPHTRYVTGQLYARTFTIGEFPEALWLLRALACNAIQDNYQPEWEPQRSEWHYHPNIKAALNVVRHIEVRDGVIVQWSNNIPGEVSGFPPTPAAPPAANSRTIKLYRV